MTLEEQLLAYIPFNEQEARDRDLMLDFLRRGERPFERANGTAHFTASAWVTTPARDRVLMIWHNVYRSWAWTGGHADGERDLLAVAMREAGEESGVSGLRPVSETPVSLEILAVNGHEKRGVYVPSHLHYNVTYLLEADAAGALRCKPDENGGAAWFTPGEALSAAAEPWMAERVYPKLIARMREGASGAALKDRKS